MSRVSPREERRRKVQERLGRKVASSTTESEEILSSPVKVKKKSRSRAMRKSTTHTSGQKKAKADEASPRRTEKDTAEEKRRRREEKKLRKERKEKRRQRRAAKELAAVETDAVETDGERAADLSGSDGRHSSRRATSTYSSRASSARSDTKAEEKLERAEEVTSLSLSFPDSRLAASTSSAEKIEQLCSSVSTLQQQMQELALLFGEMRTAMDNGVSSQCSEVSNVCSDTISTMKKMMSEFSAAHQQKMEVQREQIRLVRQEKERAASSTDTDDKRKATEMQALKRFLSTSLEEMKNSIIQEVRADMAPLREAVEKPCPRCKEDRVTPTHIDNAVTRMKAHVDAALVQVKETLAVPNDKSRAAAVPLNPPKRAALVRRPVHAGVTGGHTSRDSVDLTSPVNRHLAGLDDDDDEEDMAAESPAEAESGGEEEELRSRPRGEPTISVASALPEPVLREPSQTSEKAVLRQDSTPGIEETSDAWDVSSISSVDETRGNDETSAAPEDQRAASAHIVGARDAQLERLSRDAAAAESFGLSSSLSLTSGGEEEDEEEEAPLGRVPGQSPSATQRSVWGVEKDGASEEELVVVRGDQQLAADSASSPSAAVTGSTGQLTRHSSREDTAEQAKPSYFRVEESTSHSEDPSPDQEREEQSSEEEIDTSASSSAVSTSVESDSSSEEVDNSSRRARAPVTPSWIK